MKLTSLFLVIGLSSACSDSAVDPDTPDSSPGVDAGGDLDAAETGLRLLGRAPMQTAGDIAADPSRDLVAVSGFVGENLVLFDVSDPRAPKQLADITIGYNSDVQFKGSLLYVNHEQVGHGIDIYDTSDPSNPTLVKEIGQETGTFALADCHNTWPQPDRALLYCASTSTGELVILSTGDTGAGSPTDPVFVVSLSSPAGGIGVHDAYAAGNRLYVAFLDGGMAIYDITNPASPPLIGEHRYQDNFTHNIWPDKTGDFLFTTDEIIGGKMRVWDIRDLANITEVGSYGQNDGAVIHNVEVVGDRAYISYYTEGVVVLDVSDPSNPTRIDGHDFIDGPDVIAGDFFSALRGAWGVEPVPPLIYVSDTESGLRIYELVDSIELL